MNKVFRLLLISYVVNFSFSISAQDVQKNIIVEHFTNTRCSVCASQNPGFYNILDQNPDVIHISFHPSAPYSSCYFSMQNKTQNDARTNYYGIYGSTPNFIINGVARQSQQVNSPTVYDEFRNQTTPLEMKVFVKEYQNDTEQIEVSFDVKVKSFNNLGSLKYFIALVEDTVLYDAPNGEKIHRDVFRKSFSIGTNLPGISIPPNVGNEYHFSDNRKIENGWNPSRIYAVVILTTFNNELIQVAKSQIFKPSGTTAINEIMDNREQLSIYPNPSSNFININYDGQIQDIRIFGGDGLEMNKSISLHSKTVDISNLENGEYFIQIKSDQNTFLKKFIKL